MQFVLIESAQVILFRKLSRKAIDMPGQTLYEDEDIIL